MKEEFLSKCQSSEEGGNVFPYLVSTMCVSARTGHNIEVRFSFNKDVHNYKSKALPITIELNLNMKLILKEMKYFQLGINKSLISTEVRLFEM